MQLRVRACEVGPGPGSSILRRTAFQAWGAETRWVGVRLPPALLLFLQLELLIVGGRQE